MTAELDEILRSSFRLRKLLEQVLPPEATEYILDLVASDLAHRNFLKLTETEDGNEV